jgi:hypothetical protein
MASCGGWRASLDYDLQEWIEADFTKLSMDERDLSRNCFYLGWPDTDIREARPIAREVAGAFIRRRIRVDGASLLS